MSFVVILEIVLDVSLNCQRKEIFQKFVIGETSPSLFFLILLKQVVGSRIIA